MSSSSVVDSAAWPPRELASAELRVTMIDRSNHHLFQPLLYQVATAGLSAPAISAPIRAILAHQSNLTTLMAAVTGIDTAGKTITLEDGSVLSYDHLIVAAGSTHSYFGHDEWSALAPGLKTLEDAFEIRKRILMAFERAERETDARRRQEWLTFTVIGGGATGVEMAGTLVEIARHTLSGEFRNIDPHSARVVLVEGSSGCWRPIPGPVRKGARAVAKAGRGCAYRLSRGAHRRDLRALCQFRRRAEPGHPHRDLVGGCRGLAAGQAARGRGGSCRTRTGVAGAQYRRA
jgi:NADH dehydrogenase FAD-containing subunit